MATFSTGLIGAAIAAQGHHAAKAARKIASEQQANGKAGAQQQAASRQRQGRRRAVGKRKGVSKTGGEEATLRRRKARFSVEREEVRRDGNPLRREAVTGHRQSFRPRSRHAPRQWLPLPRGQTGTIGPRDALRAQAAQTASIDERSDKASLRSPHPNPLPKGEGA